MNKYVIGIATSMLLVSMFAVIAIGNVPEPVPSSAQVMKEVAVSPVFVGDFQPGNFTKLEVSPRYGNFRLQPGESEEITVAIKNKENIGVSVKPSIIVLPYGEYMMEKEWITVTPESVEIPAGGSQEFIITAFVPKDASIGYYSTQIAFTDEVIPTPYPEPFPNYIHSFSLSIDVWAVPVIQIVTPYISDQLEAGKEYDYEIKLKNTGNKTIDINPKLSSEPYYGGPFGQMTVALTDDAITITAPESIPAGATEVVKVHVNVPADAKGYYNGYIDLGIDDPSVREYDDRVNLNFNIWSQPTEPFVKSFLLREAAPVTIEISSNYFGSGYPFVKGQGMTQEPSFETTLEGAGGQIRLNATKTVIKGSVSMGGDIPPWEIDSASIYQEMGVQLIETYVTTGSPGIWKLKVLPRNTQGFEYTITIGE